MGVISDVLLLASALAAMAYCIILSRRLKRFNDLEKGVGGAVAVMSAQVDDMTTTLQSAQQAALSSTTSLQSLTERAEGAATQLELLVASLHDLPPSSGADANAKSQEAARNQSTGTSFFRHTPKRTEGE